MSSSNPARVVERDAREVEGLSLARGTVPTTGPNRGPRALRDQLDALLDRREHPEPEQVDLQEAGVAAAVLVPLADLPAGHRRGLHRHEVDQRARRDDHAARVLADVARQAGDLARQLAEGVPPRPRVRAGYAVDLLRDARRVPAVGDARKALELGKRQAERLADVADRTAAPVRGEARDERCTLAAVALRDADD